MTSSNGNIFCVTGPSWGESTGYRPVTRSFDIFFDLCLNNRFSKQSRRRWFEAPSRSLSRHCNVYSQFVMDSRHLSTQILQHCFTGTGNNVRLSRRQWHIPEGHYSDVIMGAMTSQVISFTSIYSAGWSKKTSKLRVTGLCAGNSPLNASNAERVSIRWRLMIWVKSNGMTSSWYG